MAIAFRNLPKGSTIGNGSYVFRHYGNEALTELPDYLCFTAEEAGSTIAMTVYGAPTIIQAFETSIDGTNWSEFTLDTTTITLANVGDKIYFRGNNITVSGTSAPCCFVMSGKIAASGNIMSLLDKTCQSTTISTDYCFYGVFSDCASLTTAPTLPATILARGCYCNMFSGCPSLITAPALPAATLAANCYDGMFLGCTELTTAPALPATILAEDCYREMFSGCTSLQVYSSSGIGHTSAWRIPTIGNASSYTSQASMFDNCPGSYELEPDVTLNTTFYTQNTPV